MQKAPTGTRDGDDARQRHGATRPFDDDQAQSKGGEYGGSGAHRDGVEDAGGEDDEVGDDAACGGVAGCRWGRRR